jgi:hypothetical protein
MRTARTVAAPRDPALEAEGVEHLCRRGGRRRDDGYAERGLDLVEHW